MRLIAAAFVLAGLTAPLAAADPPAEAPLKEKRICRETTPTGSRLPKRTCRPKSEWAAIDRLTQEQADREVGRVQAISRSEGTRLSPN